MQDLVPFGLVDRDLLLLEQRIVFRIGIASFAVASRDLVGGGDIQQRRWIDARSPSPADYIEIERWAADCGQRVGLHCLEVDPDAGLLPLVAQRFEEAWASRGGLIRWEAEAEVQRLAGITRHLANAVAVGVLVAGILKRLL